MDNQSINQYGFDSAYAPCHYIEPIHHPNLWMDVFGVNGDLLG